MQQLAVRLRGEMEMSREQKSEEERRLRELEDARGRSLVRAQASARALVSKVRLCTG